MTRILGIDPGLRHTGWGVIESHGNRLTFIACGHICPNTKRPLAQRLYTLHETLTSIIDTYQPNIAALEETFVNVNPSSTLKLGQARGGILLSLSIAEIPVAEYAATLVKKSLTGVGRADKNQIETMVHHLLPGCTITTNDEADALAIAICHASHQTLAHVV